MFKPACAIAVSALLLASCAYGPHRHRYGEQRYGPHHGPAAAIAWGSTSPFVGPGASDLDPWLRYHPDGHFFVYRYLGIPRQHQLTRGEAERANAAFRERADRNRDSRLEEHEIREALASHRRD